MVTYEIMIEKLRRTPFQPFGVVLESGEQVDVTKKFQAVTTNRLFFVGMGDYFRRIRLAEISKVVELAA